MDFLAMMANRRSGSDNRREGVITGPLKQQGNVLFLALIGLVIMTLAGLALIRSVDTTNLIAGNFAFKQTALQASDAGVEAAFAALGGSAGYASAPGTDNPPYYSVYMGSDANGLPATLPNGTAFSWTANASAQTSPISGYQVRYVIDRLCLAGTTSANIGANCFAGVSTGKNSQTVGGPPQFISAEQEYYRVSVQVTGPRNTLTYVQAIITP
jgi:type IV pilus assembly protein PilX